MLDKPDSHLFQQRDELNGHWFGRHRQICDPASRSDWHRVLLVPALTICSLRTVPLWSSNDERYEHFDHVEQTILSCLAYCESALMGSTHKCRFILHGSWFNWLVNFVQFNFNFSQISDNITGIITFLELISLSDSFTLASFYTWTQRWIILIYMIFIDHGPLLLT